MKSYYLGRLLLYYSDCDKVHFVCERHIHSYLAHRKVQPPKVILFDRVRERDQYVEENYNILTQTRITKDVKTLPVNDEPTWLGTKITKLKNYQLTDAIKLCHEKYHRIVDTEVMKKLTLLEQEAKRRGLIKIHNGV